MSHVLMGYVLRERSVEPPWVSVDYSSGGYPHNRDLCGATIWRDPVDAQEYGDRFCNDVEVLPVYVHTE